MSLPDEFVLKKYIVALVTALNILLCRFIEEPIRTDTNIAHLMKITIIKAKFKTAYIITQNWRDIIQGVSENRQVIKLLIFVDLLSALGKT